MCMVHELYGVPLTLIGCVVYLWFVVGPSCLAGILLLLILLVINGLYLANHIRILQVRHKFKNGRVYSDEQDTNDDIEC